MKKAGSTFIEKLTMSISYWVVSIFDFFFDVLAINPFIFIYFLINLIGFLLENLNYFKEASKTSFVVSIIIPLVLLLFKYFARKFKRGDGESYIKNREYLSNYVHRYEILLLDLARLNKTEKAERMLNLLYLYGDFFTFKELTLRINVINLLFKEIDVDQYLEILAVKKILEIHRSKLDLLYILRLGKFKINRRQANIIHSKLDKIKYQIYKSQ